MNEEIKRHAMAIAELLQVDGNPYQVIVINMDGIKKASIDEFTPVKTSKD